MLVVIELLGFCDIIRYSNERSIMLQGEDWYFFKIQAANGTDKEQHN